MPILNNRNNQSGRGGGQIKKPMFNLVWMYALIILALVALFYFQDGSEKREVSWTKFEQCASQGYIKKITVIGDDGIAEGYLTPEGAKYMDFHVDANTPTKIVAKISSPDKLQDKTDVWNAQLKKEGKPAMEVMFERGSSLSKLFWYFGPFVLFIGFLIFMSRRMGNNGGGGVFNVGKSRARVFDKNTGSNVTFKDVAGLAEAKVEIEEIVDFLKNPSRYTELGAKIPRGALLVGPPGTGKTLLAKAVAGEANVPFLSISGSDFVEMFVGVGAARVRDLFKQAKEKAPCIVFIDEIDAVGRARGKNPNMGANDERENTLNQMLTEMDGFSSNNGVIILAATNRADMLDKALMRPGRFDRQIYVDLPELTDRIEIFQVHLRNIKVNASLDVEQLARQTGGFSGADIANVCNEAALIAARHNKLQVEWNDFMSAIDRVVGGMEKKSRIITDDEKKSIATHEAGHATVSWLLQYGDPLVKVTIVPRGRALGAAWYSPEGRQIMPTQALLDTMCGLLAGRAAEELFLGEVGTGASNDLERTTKIARALVMVYGMSKKLPNINYQDSTGQEYGFSKPYAETTATTIDAEVTRIVAEQYERAKEILRQYAVQHNKLRDMLVEREVIFTADVENVLGKRKWKSRTDEIMAINKSNAGKKNEEDDPEYEIESEWERHAGKKNPATPKPHTDKEADAPQSASASDKKGNTHSSGNDDDDDDPGTPPPFEKM